MFVGLVLAQRYELLEKMGSGGMGSVWRAHDKTLNAEIAIKLIDPQFVESPTAIARFRREAQAAAAIRSTHVVQILDHGVDDGTPYIAMELLKGESLSQRIRSARTLTPEVTARLLGQVARALALAHNNGIVHRDLKPENVFLVREDDEDLAKVLDFGVARRNDGLADSEGLKTRTGAILGTPYYMSPEQATGQGVDHLTDIWSFGVIACECLTGKRIFTGDSLGGLFHSICMAAMPVPSQLCPVPRGFDAWFAQAASRDKSERFQTVKEASDELRLVCGRPAAGSSAYELRDTLASTPNGDHSQPEPSAAHAPSALSIPISFGEASSLATAVQTTDPSSQSIGALPRRAGSRVRLFILVAAALTAVASLASWRWLSRSNTSATAAGSPTALAPPSPAQPGVVGANPVASLPPTAQVPPPLVDTNDLPVVPDVSKALGKTVGKVAPPKPQASAAAKPSTPAPRSSAKPHVNKHVTDDNAAGI